MQLAVMSLTHSVRAIFLIIGNCIIRITSRKFISKLLLRLPSQLFPRYRVVVSGVIIQDNLQRRSMKYPPDVYNSSSSDEDDDESSTVTGKCKCCVLQKAYYHSNIDYSNDNADECVKEDPEFYKYASDIEFPEQNFVESTDGYTEVFEKNFIVKHSFVPGTPCTPPLRRITGVFGFNYQYVGILLGAARKFRLCACECSYSNVLINNPYLVLFHNKNGINSMAFKCKVHV
ncbi:unnamed protein product [Acanthoscelides obtectus]|uniref:Uncharacterized protein n=1 Tax=Acanthoscelides obtectus TaxID=200917 RepID=A0A9P0PAR8_ACAOB|nr:unnamed protein product [Acanthoscelides obtectus]CAK1685807.1 hypothetical protein AOBTE_LOCUS35630 [Acanthoscelides obtectus]